MNTQVQTVPFNGQSVTAIEKNGKWYVAMKPICENIGLDWEAQRQKIKRNHVLNSVACIIKVTAEDSKNYEMTCLPLGFLSGWLLSVEVNKVKPEIRDTLIQYQLECYDVLFKHFMPEIHQAADRMTESKHGQGELFQKTTADERTPLRQAIDALVGKYGLMYPEAYAFVHQQFSVESIEDLPVKKLPEAVEYVHRLILNVPAVKILSGEVLDKEQPMLINKDYFSHLAKMAHYATEFEKIQSMMCQSQFSKESKQFLTSLNWRVNNGAGYLFVFKPDIHNDIKQAFDFLRQQSQLCV